MQIHARREVTLGQRATTVPCSPPESGQVLSGSAIARMIVLKHRPQHPFQALAEYQSYL